MYFEKKNEIIYYVILLAVTYKSILWILTHKYMLFCIEIYLE